jgi:hypothetical protein
LAKLLGESGLPVLKADEKVKHLEGTDVPRRTVRDRFAIVRNELDRYSPSSDPETTVRQPEPFLHEL